MSSLSTPSSSSDVVNTVVSRSLPLTQIDDESFNSYDLDTRIYIAKKLYTTLYKGESIASLRREVSSGHFISDMHGRLHARNVPVPDADKIYVDDYEIPYVYRGGDRLFEKRWRIFARIASELYYTPLGEKYFNAWIAYVLDQTILFSPAYEVESVTDFPELIGSNYDRIRAALDAHEPIRQLVYEHMISKENWARFRSPEDNGREMLEIWLYDYDDAHVPLAARALQNWRWEVRREKNEEGQYGTVYRFLNDDNNPGEANTEAVEIFGESITSGKDFYRMVAQHPRLISTVVDRLVNLFFPTFGADRKKSIAKAISATNPTTFQEIVEQILFSKAYLLESDRIKSAEEVYLPLAKQFGMELTGTSFRYFMTLGMEPSHQAPFVYKLGRLDEGESDTDSVVRFHQYIRSYVFLNRKKDGVQVGALMQSYEAPTLEEYLNNMFLDVVGRKMTEDEKETLVSIIADAGIDSQKPSEWDKFAIFLMTFDYFSRLSEIYTYRTVDAGGAS